VKAFIRRALAVAAAGLLAGAVGGCGSTATTNGDAITIGLLAARTGSLQPIGTEVINGFGLYLDNHGGKLGGHHVKLVPADEGDGPATARPAADKLVKKDHVLAVTGVVNAASVQSVAAVTSTARIPLIGSVGRPSTLPDVSFIWHTSFQSVEFGQAIAGYVHAHVNGPVYVIGPDYQGGKDQIGGFVTAFTAAGGKLANTGGGPDWTPYPATTDFSPWLAKIKASGAKAVYTFYAGTSAINFVKQYDQFGLHDQIPLYGAGALTEGAALKAEGNAASGILTVAPYASNLDNAANRTFVDAYQRKYQTAPTYNAMDSWDAAAVLDRAIGTLGPQVTAAGINTALGRLGQIDSPRGPWQFSGTTHTPVQKWYLRTVHADGTVLTNYQVQDLTTLGAG
jgi:branched-chain amino acid transport system substrate-binding protein